MFQLFNDLAQTWWLVSIDCMVELTRAILTNQISMESLARNSLTFDCEKVLELVGAAAARRRSVPAQSWQLGEGMFSRSFPYSRV